MRVKENSQNFVLLPDEALGVFRFEMNAHKLFLFVGIHFKTSWDSKGTATLISHAMESDDCTPSLSQAVQMKKLSQSGELTMDKIFEILREPKANQQEKISFRVDDLRKFFPKSYSAARIQERILKLLEADCRKRQRAQER